MDPLKGYVEGTHLISARLEVSMAGLQLPQTGVSMHKAVQKFVVRFWESAWKDFMYIDTGNSIH